MPSETAGTSTADGLLRHPEVDRSKLEGGPWDGRALSYIPRRPLPIDPSLSCTREFAADIDVVTYQVLRSRFWNVNLDHSDTIRRVSGSPLIVYQDDLNTSLLTEDGDTFMSGPSVQYFTGYGDLVVKWTLRASNREARGSRRGTCSCRTTPTSGRAGGWTRWFTRPSSGRGSCSAGFTTPVMSATSAGSFPEALSVGTRHLPRAHAGPTDQARRSGALPADVHDVFVRDEPRPGSRRIEAPGRSPARIWPFARLHELLEQFGATTVKGAMRRIIRDCSQRDL